jgi:hypothetical protein
MNDFFIIVLYEMIFFEWMEIEKKTTTGEMGLDYETDEEPSADYRLDQAVSH